MNKKDKSWFFLLFLLLAIYSAQVLFEKEQIIFGGLLIILGIIFFIISLIFYFKSKKEKSSERKISILKKIAIIVFSFLIFTAVLNLLIPKKEKIDQEKIETEIQSLLKEQEELSKQAGKLQQEEKIEESEEKVKKIEENLNKALVLNQTLIDKGQENQKKELLKRKEVLEAALAIFEEIEKCMNFYPDNMDAFNNCQKEIEEMISTNIPIDKQ